MCMSFCMCILLSFFVFLFSCVCGLEVTVTSLHPPRLCRLAVFSIKPTLLSLPLALIWAGSGHEYHSFHTSHLLRSNAPVGSFSFSLSSLPIFVCWGGGVSFGGPQSPIRSLGRLPVGLGSLNEIPLPHHVSPSMRRCVNGKWSWLFETQVVMKVISDQVALINKLLKML